jgi:hypothetical protein
MIIFEPCGTESKTIDIIPTAAGASLSWLLEDGRMGRRRAHGPAAGAWGGGRTGPAARARGGGRRTARRRPANGVHRCVRRGDRRRPSTAGGAATGRLISDGGGGDARAERR